MEEGKGKLYCITLGLSILSNYYISIMICLFMVIYVIARVILTPPKGTFGVAEDSGPLCPVLDAGRRLGGSSSSARSLCPAGNRFRRF